jgi:hypothetical protein
MIKVVRWLLGSKADAIEAENDEAVQDVRTSKALRAHAEREGSTSRRLLAQNHFSDKMRTALEPRGHLR